MIRKAFIIILINLLAIPFSKTLIAPENPDKPIYIAAGTPVCIFGLTDPFAMAKAYYESRLNPYIVNPVSGARGLFQYMPVMIREVNKIQARKEFILSYMLNTEITLPRYVWDDAFNPIKSVEMYWIVQNWHNPEYYYDKACRIWFGEGVQYDGKTWEDYYCEVIEIYETFKQNHQ